MTFQRPLIILAIYIFLPVSCLAQPVANLFEKIICHSNTCFGECPEISLQIDSSRNILLKRQFFVIERMNQQKSDTNSEAIESGTFKGRLTQSGYDSLLQLLISSNINNLQFSNSYTHDIPIITLIVYSDGRKKYLKSAKPPEQAAGLISYLYQIGTELKLEKITGGIDIER